MSALGLREVDFSEKLHELRDLTGIGNKELAEKTGINLGTIKSYFKSRGQEGAREPSFSNAAKIAKAYGKDLNYFFDCDEVTEPPKARGRKK
jgi:transcriptional regulator with XRE-family HTH domain